MLRELHGFHWEPMDSAKLLQRYIELEDQFREAQGWEPLPDERSYRAGGMILRDAKDRYVQSLTTYLYHRAEHEQQTLPHPVGRNEKRGTDIWWYLDRYFEARHDDFWVDVEVEHPDSGDLDRGRKAIGAAVRVMDDRKHRSVERVVSAADALGSDHTGRVPVPVEVRRAVWERDGGQCGACGATFDLQFDHIIPVSMGGATTEQNLELLCAPCNRRKGGSLG